MVIPAPATLALLRRNSALEALVGSPTVTVFAININHYRWVQGYGEVLEYAP
jgi:hypothetical protein